jgi:hypothetical protein
MHLLLRFRLRNHDGGEHQRQDHNVVAHRAARIILDLTYRFKAAADAPTARSGGTRFHGGLDGIR